MSGQVILDLAQAPQTEDRAAIGGKAATLARLSAAGFPVPPATVVTPAGQDDPQLDALLMRAAIRLGGNAFAVRSSGVAEDLPDASYAGLYETYLNVPAERLGEAVRCCFAAASSPRVTAYHAKRGNGSAGMAVLVQTMVQPIAAGVAFTAHPVTGARDETVVTAVRGLGDPLVSGEATGEEWTVKHTARHATTARMTRPSDERVLTSHQAEAVAALAQRVARHFGGRPQDVEWAIDSAATLWLLQARPMTALPDAVSWAPPGSGLWMRNFRLGEWLPEAVTPLFATWLLPMLEHGFLEGMRLSAGVSVPFRYALINGWYYNAAPMPTPRLLARVLVRGRRRAVKTLFNALIRVSRNPAAAERAVLSNLEAAWRDQHAPRYRRLVAEAAQEVETATPQRLVSLVDALGTDAGIWLWYLAIVGGSAWKMEACLTRFVRRHLEQVLPDSEGGSQSLLRALPGAEPAVPAHAVLSVDWCHPLAGEISGPGTFLSSPGRKHDQHPDLGAQRLAAERRCRAALADEPRLLAEFETLLAVNQRYAVIREEQARDFTLAWPVLRTCAHRIGWYLVERGVVERPDDVFFCTREEVTAAIAGHVTRPLLEQVARGRQQWERQRRLAAPLALGRPPRLIGDVIGRAVQEARGDAQAGQGVIVGHPASAGRATGPVRMIHGPQDFSAFQLGEVLLAKATAPAWTPLFGRAAAVVTDGGTLAAHASLVAREYGIPAVVGTGNATTLLHDGQIVTVDGTAGTVLPQRIDPTSDGDISESA